MIAKWLIDLTTVQADAIAGSFTVDTVGPDGATYVSSNGSAYSRLGNGSLGGSGVRLEGVTYGLEGTWTVSLVDWTCELSDTTGLSDDQAERLRAAIVNHVGGVVSGSASL